MAFPKTPVDEAANNADLEPLKLPFPTAVDEDEPPVEPLLLSKYAALALLLLVLNVLLLWKR